MSSQTDQTRTLTDVMDPARAQAMQATLGLPQGIQRGSPLPPFFHHLYFWEAHPPEALGRDGHPATGGFIPDMGLPRRMWAAGRLLFHAPLLAGTVAEKRSSVESATRKEGRSGPLAFVRLRHDIVQRGTVALTEWQELVYREETPKAKSEPPMAHTDEEMAQEVAFDSTTLFRYSALTFNGHRIHYDRHYAKKVEGYPDLVVHGPLLAQHLMLLAERMKGAPLTEFSYRATAPLCLPGGATLCAKGGAVWVRGADGVQHMEATYS